MHRSIEFQSNTVKHELEPRGLSVGAIEELMSEGQPDDNAKDIYDHTLQLTPRQRELLLLRIGGTTYPQLAKLFAIPINAAREDVIFAMRKFRRLTGLYPVSKWGVGMTQKYQEPIGVANHPELDTSTPDDSFKTII